MLPQQVRAKLVPYTIWVYFDMKIKYLEIMALNESPRSHPSLPPPYPFIPVSLPLPFPSIPAQRASPASMESDGVSLTSL